jgi:hypothetical protein
VRTISSSLLLVLFLLFPVCNASAVTQPKCLICTELINGRYCYVGKNTVCEKCYKKYPRCAYCGAMVAAGGLKLSDNRVACAACASTLVRDINTALNMLKEVMAFAETELGMTPRQDCKITLVTRGAMNSAAGTSTLGLATGSQEISIPNDLAKATFYSTVAHEYGHIWMSAQNGDAVANPDLREGFAQWTSAQWCRRKGYPDELKKIEAHKGDAYSRGYAHFRAMTQQQVLAEVRAKVMVNSTALGGQLVPKEVDAMFKKMQAAEEARKKAQATPKITPPPQSRTVSMWQLATILNVPIPPVYFPPPNQPPPVLSFTDVATVSLSWPELMGTGANMQPRLSGMRW